MSFFALDRFCWRFVMEDGDGFRSEEDEIEGRCRSAMETVGPREDNRWLHFHSSFSSRKDISRQQEPPTSRVSSRTIACSPIRFFRQNGQNDGHRFLYDVLFQE